MLCDPSSRVVRYLRLSLTKACQLRCIYCRGPATSVLQSEELGSRTPTPTTPGEPALTADEIVALVGHLVARHGIRKVRLTGGDPSARPDLVAIIRRLAAIPGLRDLALTTNGLTLAEMARDYAAAGLGRVNVSLDSLDRRRFQSITGHDLLPQVLAGIEEAVEAGLTPVKINTVVMRGENDGELADLVCFAAGLGPEVRFIELMPMSVGATWADRFVPESEMRQRLDELVESWQPLPSEAGPARRYRVQLRNGPAATIGFISAMSRPFCSTCNRIRMASDGSVMACLMDSPCGSVLPALRPRFDADKLDQIVAAAVSCKPPLHAAAGQGIMTHIGG